MDDAGKAVIYRTCVIKSLAELDTNRVAARVFHEEVELAFARFEAGQEAQ